METFIFFFFIYAEDFKCQLMDLTKMAIYVSYKNTIEQASSDDIVMVMFV